MSLEDIKEKLNGIFGILIDHKEEFEIPTKDSYKELQGEYEYRMKLARDQVLLGSKYSRRLDSDTLPDDFAEKVTESFRKLNEVLMRSARPFEEVSTDAVEIMGRALSGYTTEEMLSQLTASLKDCDFTYTENALSFYADDKTNNTHEESISSLKKRIKYCKNPMEKKNLEKELNALYKSRKRRK